MSRELEFRKSSYSSGTGQNCAEVADTPEFSAIRDTQNRELGHVDIPRRRWVEFLAAVRGGADL
ncbi:DUF397 domain-containing protein [Nocardiopsis trehalosi]|uniref:DUF397 domain-containing protein n=1 Tax=Nocardiopsis trehalosi TaxID=109329 RepID=UPI00082BDEB6|nr:DUF397 domain-containing protein [Nocardiopsis trehalosi]